LACFRINDSFLASPEQKLLAGLVRRLPAAVTPDRLTAVGLAGALVVAMGFVACRWSNAGLFLVIAGLFLNWFGDSLDGTLARHRRIERPHYGYFIDHSTDLIAQTLIIVGLGLSPFFTIPSALMVLSLYLLMSSYTYLRVVTESVHRLSYGGLGATEFRILVAVWALLAAAGGPRVVAAEVGGFVLLDMMVGAFAAATFVFFISVVRGDLSRLRRLEPMREPRRPIAQAPEAELSGNPG
jgi:archaetidylinositol phosphate synthase